ncbi:dienelactone hydrolase family protein [Geovibrio thiophilus]|uniref:Dienelactone hydrolase family protein n=1 Tax=Geovibrio thiophilus TaxID=139438 RepID=A0A3R5XW84_9BACT|nr:dienelactone hydrolase family protein [Geovibrio thiophilus]QAR32167.1 dienelactone hydrolase family protein [Geovibrio thiophilus]
MKYLLAVIMFLMTASAYAGDYVVYKSGSVEYEGFYSPVSGKAPLVLIVHDWDGLGDYEVERVEMLNKLGYSAFAVDMFGKGVRPAETAEKQRLTGELYADRDRMRRILQAGVDKAKALGADTGNAVIIGYCFGGAVVLEYARSGAPLKSFISFHGGLDTPQGQDYSGAKGEVAVFHGTADAAVSMASFAKLAADLEKAGVKHEMHTYSGAPHAFTVFGSQSYRRDADEKSWKRFTEYLKEIF